MPRWDWIENSRARWSSESQPTGEYLHSLLAVGCLQRIATALETLVERSDPEKIKRDAAWAEAEAKRDEQIAKLQPFIEQVNSAAAWAINRLCSKAPSAIKSEIRAAISRGEPEEWFRPWKRGFVFDEADSVRWRDTMVAYYDGIGELPERVGKDGTKKQARYMEWKASLTGDRRLS